MPMINVKITKEGATTEQKKQVMAEMTEVLARVLGKNPATTIVIIDEVARAAVQEVPLRRLARRLGPGASCSESLDAVRLLLQRLHQRRDGG